MISRSRSLASFAIVGMMWAIGCGGQDNPLFASGPEEPGPGAGGEGGSPGLDAGDPDDASIGHDGGEGGASGHGGSPSEDGGEGGSPSVDAGEDGDGGKVIDAGPDVCSYEYVPGPLARKCRPPTDNECDGLYEHGTFPNGTTGNGFDDDCDGIVDEGCQCGPDSPAGTTKACYLVPPSQAHPDTKAPVGFCAESSKGTMSCVQVSELRKEWDGYCKGATPPFTEDGCTAFDYDCDGIAGNSRSLDCRCDPKPTIVTCPTAPIVTSPYPDPTDLTKKKDNPLDPDPSSPFILNGHDWITGANPHVATNWKWTVTGGDCDNILPQPSFAIYNGPNANTAARIGTKANSLGTGKQTGFVVGGAGSVQSQIWPAFSLSGDYVVQGEFDIDGEHYECSVKVQTRWPGLRAELCWDTVGNVDIDLHLARLQGQSCANYGWFDTCSGLDCDYGNCRDSLNLSWGYPASPDEACKGWGSRRSGSCNNPRLDRDTISCTRTEADPTNNSFCAPENANIDNPNAGDMFAIGVHHYSGANARPHVNVYCNGERKLSSGYDPTTTPPSNFPFLQTAGTSRGAGDFWSVARVTWLGGAGADACEVEPVPSQNPKPSRDGSSAHCVDLGPRNSTTGSNQWHFKSPGSSPPTGPMPSPFQSGQWFCWH